VRKEATELRFFEILKEFGGMHIQPLLAFAPAKCNDKINSDCVFYNVVGGDKQSEKRVTLNKCLIAFGINEVQGSVWQTQRLDS